MTNNNKSLFRRVCEASVVYTLAVGGISGLLSYAKTHGQSSSEKQRSHISPTIDGIAAATEQTRCSPKIPYSLITESDSEQNHLFYNSCGYTPPTSIVWEIQVEVQGEHEPIRYCHNNLETLTKKVEINMNRQGASWRKKIHRITYNVNLLYEEDGESSFKKSPTPFKQEKKEILSFRFANNGEGVFPQEANIGNATANILRPLYPYAKDAALFLLGFLARKGADDAYEHIKGDKKQKQEQIDRIEKGQGEINKKLDELLRNQEQEKNVNPGKKSTSDDTTPNLWPHLATTKEIDDQTSPVNNEPSALGMPNLDNLSDLHRKMREEERIKRQIEQQETPPVTPDYTIPEARPSPDPINDSFPDFERPEKPIKEPKEPEIIPRGRGDRNAPIAD